MSDTNDAIPIQVDATGAEGVERIVSAIDRLQAALSNLGGGSASSALLQLEDRVMQMQMSLTNGLAEVAAVVDRLGAKTVHQIEENGNLSVAAIEASGLKMKAADARTWGQIQAGSATNVKNAFNQLAQGIPVEAVQARYGQLATTSAVALDGQIENLGQFIANSKSLHTTYFGQLASETEASLAADNEMHRIFFDAGLADMEIARVKGLEVDRAHNATQQAAARAAADKLLEIDIASENARSSALQALIEKRDLWTAEANAREVELNRAFHTKMLLDDAAQVEREDTLRVERIADYIAFWQKIESAQLAAEARQAAIQESRDLLTHESNQRQFLDYVSFWEKTLEAQDAAQALQLSKERHQQVELATIRGGAAESQRVLNTNFLTASPQQQISTAQKAAVYSGLGGDAAAKYGSSAASADVSALIAQDAATRAVAKATAELTGVQAGLRAATTATTAANVEQALSMKDLEGAVKGASHQMGIFGMHHGQMVSMIVGAGLAATLHHIAVSGAEVEYQLASLSALSSNAAPINMDKFVGISAGTLSSLKEAAEGVHALAQAGFTEGQAFAALPDLLRLSTLGEMNVAEAAMLAVESMHAFGKEATDLGNVTDILVKVSSSANVSVEKLATGMKSASTMGRNLGMSMEQVTVLVAEMEKRGLNIQPLTTALSSLYEPTKKVAEVMHQVGLSTRDALGGLKDPIIFLGELKDKLSGLKVPADLLAELVPKRSQMALSAAVDSLHEIKHGVEEASNAAGFAFTAMIAKSDTVEGSFKQLSSTVSGSFLKAFEQASPVIRQVETDLLEMAKSKETVDLLSALAVTATRLTQLLIEHGQAILIAAGAYAALKVVSGVSTMLANYVLQQEAAAVAQRAATLAAEAQTVALAGLSAEARIAAVAQLAVGETAATAGTRMAEAAVGARVFTAALGWIGVALTLAAVAYEAFHSTVDADEAKRLKLNNTIDATKSAYDQEIAKLKELEAQLDKTGDAGTASASKVLLANLQAQKASDIGRLAELDKAYTPTYTKGRAGAMLEDAPSNKAQQKLHDERVALKKDLATTEAQLATQEARVATLDAATEAFTAKQRNHKLQERMTGLTAAAGLDTANGGNAKTRGLASEITGIQQLVVTNENYAGVLATVNSEYAKLQDAKSNAAARPDKAGAKDALGAAIAANALKKQIDDDARKTDLLDAKRDNQSGALGDVSYLQRKAEIAKQAIQDTIDQAKADKELVQSVENKLRATQTYNNLIARAKGQRGQVDEQLEINVDAHYDALARQNLLVEADNYKKRGDLLDAYLTKYEADNAVAIDKVTNDLSKLDMGALEAALFIDPNNTEALRAYNQAMEATIFLRNKATEKTQGVDNAAFNTAKGQSGEALASMQSRIPRSAGGGDLASSMDRAIAAQQEYSSGLDGLMAKQREMASLAATPEQSKSAADDLEKIKAMGAEVKNAWADVGKAIEKSLTDAFGKAGASIGGLLTATIAYGEKKDAIAKSLSDVDKADPAKLAAAQDKAAKDSAQAQISNYAALSHAAKGFFAQNTTGYKVLSGIEKEMQIISLAMQAEKLYTSLLVSTASATGVVAGQAVETDAVLTAQGIQNAAKVPGVFMSFMSAMGPWGAAAAAIAIGAVMGGAFSGGGSTGPSESAANQGTTGVGTVLGSSNTDYTKGAYGSQSESISKSLEIIAKDSGLGLVHSQSMMSSLQTVASSITNLTAAIASTAGVLVGGVAGVSTNQASFLSKLFGGSSTSITDQGIKVSGGSLASIAQNGVNSQAYTNTETSSWWHTSQAQDRASLGADQNRQFQLTIEDLAKSVVAAATTIGLGGAALTAKMQTFQVAIADISAKGLTGDAFAKQVQAAFSKLGDQMATFAVDGVTKFAQVGEGALQTLARVANDFVQVTDVMTVLGQSLRATGLDAVALDENFIAAAGGIDKLTAGTQKMVSDIFTAAEKAAPVQASVNAAMAALGQSSVKTIAQFDALVHAQDLNTVAGQAMYLALMNIEPAFKTAADATTAQATALANIQTAMMTAQGNTLGVTAANRQAELDALQLTNPELVAMQKSLYAVQDSAAAVNTARTLEIALMTAQGDVIGANAARQADALKLLAMNDPASVAMQTKINAYSNAQKSITDAYNAQSAAITSAVSSMAAYTLSMTNFQQSLLTGNLSTLTPAEQYAQASAKFASTVLQAQSGDTAAQGQVQAMATAFLTASRTSNASDSQYQTDFATVQTALGHVAEWATTQQAVSVTAAWTQAQAAIVNASNTSSLAALNKQVSGIIEVKTAVMTVTDAIDALSVALGAPAGAPVTAGTVRAAAPAPYQANYTQTSAIVAPLTAQMVDMKASNDAMIAELKGLRADQQAHTAALITAEFQSAQMAADQVSASTVGAAKEAAWAAQNGAALV